MFLGAKIRIVGNASFDLLDPVMSSGFTDAVLTMSS